MMVLSSMTLNRRQFMIDIAAGVAIAATPSMAAPQPGAYVGYSVLHSSREQVLAKLRKLRMRRGAVSQLVLENDANVLVISGEAGGLGMKRLEL